MVTEHTVRDQCQQLLAALMGEIALHIAVKKVLSTKDLTRIGAELRRCDKDVAIQWHATLPSRYIREAILPQLESDKQVTLDLWRDLIRLYARLIDAMPPNQAMMDLCFQVKKLLPDCPDEIADAEIDHIVLSVIAHKPNRVLPLFSANNSYRPSLVPNLPPRHPQ